MLSAEESADSVVASSPNGSKSAKTGDEAPLVLAASAMAASLAVIVIALHYRRTWERTRRS